MGVRGGKGSGTHVMSAAQTACEAIAMKARNPDKKPAIRAQQAKIPIASVHAAKKVAMR